MSYDICYTDVKLPQETKPDCSKLVLLKFETKERAIEMACKIMEQPNGIVWRITGPDGFIMERADVEEECRKLKQIRKWQQQG